jgi:hypothetical protein
LHREFPHRSEVLEFKRQTLAGCLGRFPQLLMWACGP